MSYIFLKDVMHVKKIVKSVLLFNLLPVVIYIVINLFVGQINNDLILDVLSLRIKFGEAGIIEMVLFLIDIFTFIYVGYLLFANDIIFGKENVFLRMKKSRWIILKLFSVFIFTFLILSIKSLIILIFFKILGYGILKLGFLLLKQIMYLYMIELLTILIHVTLSKFSINHFGILLMLLFVINFPTNIQDIHFFEIVIFLVIIIIILITIFSKKGCNILERSDI